MIVPHCSAASAPTDEGPPSQDLEMGSPTPPPTRHRLMLNLVGKDP